MIKRAWKWIQSQFREPAAAVAKAVRESGFGLALAVIKAKQSTSGTKNYRYPIQEPSLFPGVVPNGSKAAVSMAMDSNSYQYAQNAYAYGADVNGFPGYPYLAMLATRAEYRALATALSTEITREWIVLNSTESAGDDTKKKVTELTQAVTKLGLQHVIQLAVEHDAYFGRGQIFIEITNPGGTVQDQTTPLIVDSRTIPKGAGLRVVNVEPMWTTPVTYDALDPTSPSFYKPSKWWMLGREVHASRLATVITRPVPDMLKPAFNFSGMSLSQLAEAYVDNWLRTRQSVSDLINNFSITALATSMEQVLQGTDDGTNLFSRAELFTATRSNRGLMLIDKDKEELVQINTPLSGLHELQAQAQEQMCSVGKTPSTILLGVAPAGFGNVAEGEVTTWENWVSANQEAFYRPIIELVLKLLQLSLYGAIDPDITFTFQPLRQMTAKELAEIRTANSTTASNLIDRGVIDPIEERERLARDPESGYQGLDLNLIPSGPGQAPEGSGNEDDDEKD